MVSGGKFLKLMQKSQIDYPIQGYMSPGKSPKLEKTKLTKLSLMERSEQKNQIVFDLVCQYIGVVPQLSKLSDAASVMPYQNLGCPIIYMIGIKMIDRYTSRKIPKIIG